MIFFLNYEKLFAIYCLIFELCKIMVMFDDDLFLFVCFVDVTCIYYYVCLFVGLFFNLHFKLVRLLLHQLLPPHRRWHLGIVDTQRPNRSCWTRPQ